MDHFSRRSWLEATPHSEGLTEAISYATLSSLKQLLNDVIFICFTYNNLFALAMIKNHIITKCTHPWQQRRNTSEQNAQE